VAVGHQQQPSERQRGDNLLHRETFLAVGRGGLFCGFVLFTFHLSYGSKKWLGKLRGVNFNLATLTACACGRRARRHSQGADSGGRLFSLRVWKHTVKSGG